MSFGAGLKVKRRPRSWVVRTLALLDSLPDYEIDFILSEQYEAIAPDGDFVYTVEGTVRTLAHPGPKATLNELGRVWASERLIELELDQRLQILRLAADTAADTVAFYLYNRSADGTPELSSSTRRGFFGTHWVKSLTAAEIALVNQLADSIALPFRSEYVALAHRHFEESFRVEDLKLQFLLLMIALEILYNDGHQELKYRIARGCGVLLGNSSEEGAAIYDEVRKLYDLRSIVVHAGKTQALDDNRVRSLRTIVRRSVLASVRLGLSKDAMSALLTQNGFGALQIPLPGTATMEAAAT